MVERGHSPRARHDEIHQALVWEDADVLVAALRPGGGDTIVSIASAGDNVFALLAAGAERVIALDANPAQLACVRLRAAMYATHTHDEFLELIGSRPSGRRAHLLMQAASRLSAEDRAFWASRQEDLVRHGVGGIGVVERRFRTFRQWALPFIHNEATVSDLLRPRAPEARKEFFEKTWNNWGWRMMMRVLCSRAVMKRMGLDAAALRHAGGVVAEAERLLRKAMVDQDPSSNPYLHWMLTGDHGEALPRAFEAHRHEVIRNRLDRLEVRAGTVETLAAEGVKADGFNMSDVFETMTPEAHEKAYAAVLQMARPGARLAYWNMTTPRSAPASLAGMVKRSGEVEAKLKPIDRAFFYSDFVVEEVL